MTPLGLVYTTIGGVDITPKNLMKTVWGIVDQAKAMGMAGTRRELFEGFWKDYRELKDLGKVDSLGDYIRGAYPHPVPYDDLPTVSYYEYRTDKAIRERLPRGTDSQQWFIVNDCFDTSPDGPNLLWLGRKYWEEGYTARGDGDEMLSTWAEYVNRVCPLEGGRIAWMDVMQRFIWVV